MASLADKPAYRPMTVQEFLDAAVEGRAELEDGILYMMTGGTVRHAAVIQNISVSLHNALRRRSCHVFGPDLPVRTSAATVRSPDVSVYCDVDLSERGADKLIGDPKLVVEVLSPSSSSLDQKVKLEEYRGLNGLDAVLIVDPEARRIRIVERTGPEAWSDQWLPAGSDAKLACLGVTLTAADVFGGS